MPRLQRVPQQQGLQLEPQLQALLPGSKAQSLAQALRKRLALQQESVPLMRSQ